MRIRGPKKPVESHEQAARIISHTQLQGHDGSLLFQGKQHGIQQFDPGRPGEFGNKNQIENADWRLPSSSDRQDVVCDAPLHFAVFFGDKRLAESAQPELSSERI